MKSLKIVLLVLVVLGLTYCNQGDTGGGLQQAFPGSVLTADSSNGASGLTIRANSTVPLGGTIEYLVEATDANGSPLPFIPVTCDTEQCLDIIEPSTGIASTSSGGGLSGVLGGSCLGSFIMECRGPLATGLVARMGFRVAGTAPSGFTGFAGAAGGGLGGGSAVVNGGTVGTTTGGTTTGGTATTGGAEVEEVTFNDAVFRTVTPSGASEQSQTGEIDTIRETDCDTDTDGLQPGAFTNDFAVFNITNNRVSAIQIDNITYSVQGVVTSTFTQLSQVIIPAQSNNETLEALFTDLVNGGKEYVGTSVLVDEDTTTNVTFTITGTNIDGTEPFTLFRSAVIAADNYDLCP